MHKTYTASRISEGNVYSCISSVHIETPIIGFSTISFYAFGNLVSIHGFLKSETIQMRQIIIAHQR